MIPAQINVLIACEESQAECKAFREAGFNAYSCDIQPSHGGHPGKYRSRTFPQVAAALARQWGSYILDDLAKQNHR